MSVLSAFGQEDDDFAYQDEHIEIESDNQEYEDLDEGEFGSDPLPINLEIKSAIPPIAPIPKATPVASPPGAIPLAPRQEISTPVVKEPPQQVVGSSESDIVRPRRRSKKSAVKKASAKRSRKVVPPRSTRGADGRTGQTIKKARRKKPGIKRTQAAPKKAVAKAAKKASGTKMAGHKNSPPARQKTARKPVRKLTGKGTARTKRRRV